jgi:flagellar motor switch protein FliN
MAEPVPDGAAAWVAETWSAKLVGAIEAMTGERPQAVAKAAEAASPPGVLWWRHPLSVGPEAMVSIGAPEASWMAIGKHLLASAGIEASEPADARNTFLEISSQALSGLCQALSTRLGSNVSSESGSETAPPAGSAVFGIGLTLETALLPLYVSVSTGLADALAPGKAAPDDPIPAATATKGSLAESGYEIALRKKESNPLELVMEVELAVSVSFGRAELPLRDVLKLTTGSIVELNRGLTDPVEIIVNKCIIARGEVVVIDGNYGVRIQEIVSRDKRMGTLR